MKAIRFAALVVMGVLFVPGQIFASNTVLSAVFEGGDSKMDPLPGNCQSETQLVYQDTGTLQVAADGDYLILDAFEGVGRDAVAYIYDGPFDPAQPEANLLTPIGVDIEDVVTLISGVTYRLVVQQYCGSSPGAWSFTVSGPGNVISDVTRVVPEFTQGQLLDTDPVAETQCGLSTPYHESAVHQVPVSGTYYFIDISDISTSLTELLDICVQVYTQPFDPNNPEANRVATSRSDGDFLDWLDTIDLEAGQDYYFVTQPYATDNTGEYFYLLAPPAPFRINKSLAGAWYYPPTSGQGFFIDVYESVNQLFLAWFTFDLTRPDPIPLSGIGEPGHRWMTALGDFSGNVANLTIYWSEGGVFDSETPVIPPAVPDGTMTVEFTNCLEGTVEYNLGTAGQSGTVPIQTIVPDHVELCEMLTKGPGVPQDF